MKLPFRLPPSLVQAWQNGLTFGIAQAAGVPGSQAAVDAAETPATTHAPTLSGRSALDRIIRPSARDRWMTGSLRNYEPDQIEGIIRGAFAGNLTQRWQLFDLMTATWPRLMKNLAELTQAVTDHEWPMQPYCETGKKATPEALRRRAVVEDVLWGMMADPTVDEGETEDLLRDMADAWAKGISVQELDWEVRTSPHGPVMGLRCSRWIHPRCYGYPASLRGTDRLMLRVGELALDNPALLAQMADLERRGLVERDGDWFTFPKDKFLVCVAKQKSGHPIGGALLQPLAWWWAVSNFAAAWMVEKAQMFGVPIRIAYYGPDADEHVKRQIMEMLQNMGAAGAALLPAGVQLEIKEAVTNATGDPSAAVQLAADMACDLLVIGNATTSSQGQRGRDLSTERMDQMSQRKRALLNWTARRINRQLIPMICRQNFGDTNEMPFVTTGDEAEKDAKATAETVGLWVDNGLQVGKAWAHERAGIPEPDPGEPVLSRGPAAAPPIPGQPPEAEQSPMARPMGGNLPQPTATAMAMAARSPFLAQAAAGAADVALADAVAGSLPGITEEWTRGVRPYLLQLVMSAQNPDVTEEQFRAMISRAQQHLPEHLAPLLDTQALATAMERAMGSAMVGGIEQTLKQLPTK